MICCDNRRFEVRDNMAIMNVEEEKEGARSVFDILSYKHTEARGRG